MKDFFRECGKSAIASICVLCLILSAAVWYEGAKRSSEIQATAENLGKDYAGGGWYPANGTDYTLEARVVGQDGWVSNVINVERGDQVEFRLRIASSDSVQLNLSVDAVTCRAILGDQSKNEGEIAAILDPASLAWVSSVTEHYDSPDALHIAYLPIGIYEVEDNWLSDATGVDVLGVICDNADEIFSRKIFVIPTYSEVNFRAVLGLAGVSLICFFILVLMIWRRRAYEKECYAWS